jgi:hypothetical protein
MVEASGELPNLKQPRSLWVRVEPGALAHHRHQPVGIEWFSEEPIGARTAGELRGGNLVMPRNEDHRHVRVRGCEAFLDLETGHGAELHVEDDARRWVGVGCLQELLGGRERGHGEPFRAQKSREGGAHGRVVVHDGDPVGLAGRNRVPRE